MSNFNNVEKIEAALSSPDFSHVRAGSGALFAVRWVYLRDAESPSGFLLSCAGDADVVEPLLLRLRATSPLSPTERY